MPKELILVDDGSTDDSVNIIRAYNKLFFLKPILFKQNKGFTVALNAGLEAASGKYIMRADPDDLLFPDRIEKQINYLKQHPETDMLGCNAIYIDTESGQPINRTNFPLRHKDIVTTYRKGEHGLLHGTVCGKSEIYRQYRYQDLAPGEDYELFARMVLDGKRFSSLKEVLYKIRVHPQSSTSQIGKESIVRTFRFRDQLFGTRTSRWKIWKHYQHIRHYRRWQLSSNVLKKYMHLLVAILLYPKKLFRRII